MSARVWLCSLLLPWKGNGPPRYTFMFQSKAWPWDCIGYCRPPCPPIPCLKGIPPTGSWDGCWVHALVDIIISGWPDDIKEVPCPLYPYWQLCESLTVEDGLVFHGEALIIPTSDRRRSLVLCTNHIKASQKHSYVSVVVFSGLVSIRPLRKLFGNMKHAWDFRLRMLLHHSHQHLHLHVPGRYVHQTFTLDGRDYLILADFYSKVILVCNLPTGQSNSAKSSTS